MTTAQATREHCIECRLSFVLVDRCDKAPSTCVDCAAQMRPSYFGERDECHRMIQVGDCFHLEWAKLCRPCAEKIRRNGGPHCQCKIKATP